MSTPTFPIKWVSEKTLRKIFNKHYLKKASSGEFRKIVGSSKHMSSPPPGEPFCTHSQYVRYYSAEYSFVAGAHQYLRPDGNIGASGKPDPKQLLHNNIMYKTNKRKK